MRLPVAVYLRRLQPQPRPRVPSMPRRRRLAAGRGPIPSPRPRRRPSLADRSLVRAAPTPDWPQWGRSPVARRERGVVAQPLARSSRTSCTTRSFPPPRPKRVVTSRALSRSARRRARRLHGDRRRAPTCPALRRARGSRPRAAPNAWDSQIWNVQKLRWSSRSPRPRVALRDATGNRNRTRAHLEGGSRSSIPRSPAGFPLGSGPRRIGVSRCEGRRGRNPDLAVSARSIRRSSWPAASRRTRRGTSTTTPIRLDLRRPWHERRTRRVDRAGQAGRELPSRPFASLVPSAPRPGRRRASGRFSRESALPRRRRRTPSPPTGPCGTQRPGHQRHPRDRPRRHRLHRQPRPSERPLRVSRRRRLRAGAALGGVASRPPLGRLRRAASSERIAGRLPRRYRDRCRSGDEPRAGRTRHRPLDLLAGRARGRRRALRRVHGATTIPADIFMHFDVAGPFRRRVRLRLGHHAGRLRARRDVLDSFSRTTITTSGSYCFDPELLPGGAGSIRARVLGPRPAARVEVSQHQYGKLPPCR